MRFETYFVLNQEVMVQRFATTKQSPRIESCRATLIARDGAVFALRMHSSEQAATFSPGDFLELHSDRFELGVRLTGSCLNFSGDLLWLEVNDDLSLYYRRQFWRVTLPVWHGVLQTEQTAKPLYEVWEEAQNQRDDNDLDPSIQVEIVRRDLNIGAGGVRIELLQPIALQDNCLFYLCLDDAQSTICVMCEVVWVEPGESDKSRLCGLRFANLLENDLKRIDQYVTQHCNFDSSESGTPYERSHTV